MICIYHNRDMDGFCSGAIVKYRYPEAKLVGYDYAQPIPWDEIPKGESIIMIDVSFPMEDMQQLAIQSNNNFLWIDHHKSAIEAYNSFEFWDGVKIDTVLEIGRAACELGWEHFSKDVGSGKVQSIMYAEAVPEAVTLIGEYDTWRHKRSPYPLHTIEVEQFQYGMRAICNSPETFPSELFRDYTDIHEEIYRIKQKGDTVLQYQNKLYEFQCENNAFEYKFEGYRAICLNGGAYNADAFKSVYSEREYDIMMPFQFNGSVWRISMYSSSPWIDCSAIAKKYGGGGHAGAARFTVRDINTIFKF